MDLQKDFDWKDLKDGYPKPNRKIIMHTQGIYTGEYEIGKEHPPRGS